MATWIIIGITLIGVGSSGLGVELLGLPRDVLLAAGIGLVAAPIVARHV